MNLLPPGLRVNLSLRALLSTCKCFSWRLLLAAIFGFCWLHQNYRHYHAVCGREIVRVATTSDG